LNADEKRRLAIAIAIIDNPQLVIFDEPTLDLNIDSKRLIWNLINEIRKERTVILVTNSFEEAEALSTRLAILVQGRLRCYDSM